MTDEQIEMIEMMDDSELAEAAARCMREALDRASTRGWAPGCDAEAVDGMRMIRATPEAVEVHLERRRNGSWEALVRLDVPGGWSDAVEGEAEDVDPASALRQAIEKAMEARGS